MIQESRLVSSIRYEKLDPNVKYYRYVSNEELQRIKRNSENGVYVFNQDLPYKTVYFTTDYYYDANVARSMLALKYTPEYRLAFSTAQKGTCIKGIIFPYDCSLSQGLYEVGGGIEYLYQGELTVNVEFPTNHLSNSAHNCHLYLARLKQLANDSAIYGFNQAKFIEDIKMLNGFINKLIKDKKSSWSELKNELLIVKDKFGYVEKSILNKKWIMESYYFFLISLDPMNIRKVVDQVEWGVNDKTGDDLVRHIIECCESVFKY